MDLFMALDQMKVIIFLELLKAIKNKTRIYW